MTLLEAAKALSRLARIVDRHEFEQNEHGLERAANRAIQTTEKRYAECGHCFTSPMTGEKFPWNDLPGCDWIAYCPKCGNPLTEAKR